MDKLKNDEPEKPAVPDGYREVFSRYITRNGKRLPPPPGKKAWRFLVKD